jgi:uncharacterized protein YdeI (YjbR/CyaY-like superfamily)
VTAEVCSKAGVAGGDTVDVEIQVDTEPHQVILPSDFKQALERDAGAKENLEGLSYSNKRRYVIPIDEAKTAETRQRRIVKTIDALRDGRA